MTSVESVNAAKTRQSLKFTLGDFTFWQFGFDAAVLDPPLAQILNQPAGGPPLDDKAADVHVVRSLRTERRMPRMRVANGFLHYVPMQERRYYIEFAASFKDYLAKFSKKSRGNWQRKVKKFTAEAGGTVDWRQYRTPQEMAEFYKLAGELSRKTYQEKIFSEGFASFAGSGERIAWLAERGRARGCLLYFNGQPIAYIFCNCDGDTIRYSIVGYDQAYGELRPGDVLLYLLIEALHEERAFRYLDFGEGAAWYKDFYSTNSVDCARLYRFPFKPKYAIAVGLHSATNAVTSMVGAVLDRLALRQRLRRALRRTSSAETD